MPDFVRIKDPATGAEFTYDTAKVEALGLEDAVIDRPALGPDGLPAPTKPRLPKGEPLPGSQSARRRAAKKTAAKKTAAVKKATDSGDSNEPGAPETTGADSSGEDDGQPSATPEKEN